jgi:hypothetical protein
VSLIRDVVTNPITLITIGGVLYKLFQKAYRAVRDHEIDQNFVFDMATNHLPHIYHVQSLICEKLGVEVTEPPAINFIRLDHQKE